MKCENCVFYEYDEEWDEYYCGVNMDEDEYARLHADTRTECPYYREYDEYKTAAKQ